MSANHNLVAYKNVEGHGHGSLDFNKLNKALFNLRVLVAKGLKINFRRRKRRLVGGPIFEKMRVASWHI
jgi:hypothetical protein